MDIILKLLTQKTAANHKHDCDLYEEISSQPVIVFLVNDDFKQRTAKTRTNCSSTFLVLNFVS